MSLIIKKNHLCKLPLTLLCAIRYWSVNVCVSVLLKSLCIFLSALSTFGASIFLPALNLHSPQLPSFPEPSHYTCGPGGAGACSPEDRGSAGSQKHLSVPLPLYPKAPGTALNSAPGASECVFQKLRLAKYPRVHECVSACPRNTPLCDSDCETHGLLDMVAAPTT